MRKCTEVGFNLGEKNTDITCHSENLFLENCEHITNSIFFGKIIPKKNELVIHFKIKTDRIVCKNCMKDHSKKIELVIHFKIKTDRIVCKNYNMLIK